jgi:hypothetical protein
LFGPVASDSTCWRLLDRLDFVHLGAVARARAAAREVVWAQQAGLVINLGASVGGPIWCGSGRKKP